MNLLKNPDFYRPKTYLMLAAVLCTFFSVLFSFVTINGQNYSLTNLVQENSILNEIAKKEIWRVQIAFTMAVITGMTVVYGVTFPNERSKQMKFCLFATFPAMFQFLLMFQFAEAIQSEIKYLGLIFPIIATLLLFIARFLIRLEHNKIQKMNRLWD